MQVEVGQLIERHLLTTIQGSQVHIPDAKARWVHLQFRRFAGCPICNLHLRTIARRHEEIAGAGIREVAHLGLPADFLIDSGGRVAAAKYGRHADDQWTVDELLALAGTSY